MNLGTEAGGKNDESDVFYECLVIRRHPEGAKISLNLCVLRVFCRIWTVFEAIEPTRSKTRSIPSDNLLKSLLRMGPGTIFGSLLGSLGYEKTDENCVFYECFAIYRPIWTQLGTIVVQ